MYTIGEKIKFTLFGKSHGPCVGGILEGIPPGMKINEDLVKKDMNLRKPSPGIGTPRREEDTVEFVQGVKNGVTDGNPILIIIENKNKNGEAYLKFAETPRPGHSDLPALIKYSDYDIRGGGQFSGRLTAAVVAAGSVAKQFLSYTNIEIAAFTRSIGSVIDENERNISDALNSVAQPTRACSEKLNDQMTEEIMDASKDNDSIGGVVECITVGLPIGFGGIWFQALDSEIARGIFSIPACKGVEFGKGFELAKMKGSESNDSFYYDETIKTRTNNMGGILGGMSDGAPMVFRAAFKPTPSIGKEQNTVNLKTKTDDRIAITGRHDPCIVPRAVSVVEAVTALIVADQTRRES